MNSEIKKVLKKIEQSGFESYIVGGFVRDSLLCRATNDIDIATNALPKDILSIFGNSKELGNYGTFNLKTNHFNYDITTYRTEKKYNNRRPKTIIYTNNLLEDLQRRDFTINAICMNSKGKILDPLNAVEDLELKLIKTIGDPTTRIIEDPLRILRAIRFASTLDFNLEENLKKAIIEQSEKIRTLSNFRIKQELDKILISPNYKKGLKLLKEYKILDLLEIYPENELTYVEDINGMWAQIITNRDLLFTKSEKKQINIIKELIALPEITSYNIFQYELYSVSVAAKIKGIPDKIITKIYKKMPIKEVKELNITFEEIKCITNITEKECKKIQEKLIKSVLKFEVKNKKDQLMKYIKEHSYEF